MAAPRPHLVQNTCKLNYNNYLLYFSHISLCLKVAHISFLTPCVQDCIQVSFFVHCRRHGAQFLSTFVVLGRRQGSPGGCQNLVKPPNGPHGRPSGHPHGSGQMAVSMAVQVATRMARVK